MTLTLGVERGREAFARSAWADAYAQLAAAERESPPLSGEDLERFAKGGRFRPVLLCSTR